MSKTTISTFLITAEDAHNVALHSNCRIKRHNNLNGFEENADVIHTQMDRKIILEHSTRSLYFLRPSKPFFENFNDVN